MSIRQGNKTIAGNGLGKANTDLSNLTSAGANIANWSSNVSNCITNIPQDIKMELNNGTLTLKAGSKVYVPNGFEADGTTPKFDVKVVTQDKTSSFSWMTTGTYLLMCFTDTNIDAVHINNIYSGTSFPTSPKLGMVCYRTDENKVYRFENSNWYNVLALPLALISSTSSGVSSIDQIFNGFGYIGSTVFALPGVKGLFPNGRNADGSLKNIEIIVSNVITQTTYPANKMLDFVVRQDGVSGGISELGWNYNEAENQTYNSIGAKANWVPCVRFFIDSNAKITSFKPKTPFHAVDYSDTEYMAHQAIPSAKRISLTATNEGAYTAPADGYFVFFATANASNGYAGLRRSGLVVSMFSSLINTTSSAIEIPVRKGEVIILFYGNVSSVTFYFEYAQGATNE